MSSKTCRSVKALDQLLSDGLRGWAHRASILALCLVVIAPVQAGVGDLDNRFGPGGQVQVAGNSGPSVLEMPDGRILVVGMSTSSEASSDRPPNVAVNRYLASGEPDASFGKDGRVAVALPVDVMLISAAALQVDGSVVMAGSYWDEGGQPFVARVGRDGSLDPSFGSGGLSTPGTGATEPFYSSLVVQPDGEILATISDWTSDRIDRFAADGRPQGSLSGAIAPHRMARQSDGRLIVSGYNRDLRRSVVMRLESDGRVDRTFGLDGFAVLDDSHAWLRYTGNISIEPGSDRIVLCGPGVVRLTSDGYPDTTFGLQGTGYVAFGNHSVPIFDYCNRLVTLKGGTIAFIGIRAGQGSGGSDRAFVAGLTSTGTVDMRFGSGTGASEISLGEIRGSPDSWFDVSSSFIAMHNGNALLTWMTTSGGNLKLARIDLGGDTGVVVAPAPAPAPVVPAPPPATTPAPTSAPAIGGGTGNGGGGQFALLNLVVLALGLLRRRIGTRDGRFRLGHDPRNQAVRLSARSSSANSASVNTRDRV